MRCMQTGVNGSATGFDLHVVGVLCMANTPYCIGIDMKHVRVFMHSKETGKQMDLCTEMMTTFERFALHQTSCLLW